MKLHPDRSSVQAISGYGEGWIAVDGERIDGSVVLGSAGQRIAWRCERFADLDAAHFLQLAQYDTELVLFGSGKLLRFPPVAWLAPLMQRGIGFETMDTHAACRTYNILAAEGRRIMAALLLEAPDR